MGVPVWMLRMSAGPTLEAGGPYPNLITFETWGERFGCIQNLSPRPIRVGCGSLSIADCVSQPPSVARFAALPTDK